MQVTLVSAWYTFKAKQDINIYKQWINNFLLNVKQFNLVIFTNKDSSNILTPYINNLRIKVIILEIEDFYTYKYKEQWINNHKQNTLLVDKIDWQVNMLWCEKIYFINRVITKNYFNNTLWYGWCDIGYFRGRENDVSIELIKNWPNMTKISRLDINKIYYTQICDDNYLNTLIKVILQKTTYNLPITPIPINQVSVAGGFFLTTKNNVIWWNDIFYKKLELYFKHNYMVKDDQIIIIDCIADNLHKFNLIKHNNNYDKWFGFSHYLL